MIEASREDDLSGRVELHRGQATFSRVSVVSIQTFLHLGWGVGVEGLVKGARESERATTSYQ